VANGATSGWTSSGRRDLGTAGWCSGSRRAHSGSRLGKLTRHGRRQCLPHRARSGSIFSHAKLPRAARFGAVAAVRFGATAASSHALGLGRGSNLPC
jgi:hypothetical protein